MSPHTHTDMHTNTHRVVKTEGEKRTFRIGEDRRGSGVQREMVRVNFPLKGVKKGTKLGVRKC